MQQIAETIAEISHLDRIAKLLAMQRSTWASRNLASHDLNQTHNYIPRAWAMKTRDLLLH